MTRILTRQLGRKVAICTTAVMLAANSPSSGPAPAFPDNPEPGLQGEQMVSDNPGSILAQPYSKGVRVVGQSTV